jgi:TctA family transporter
MNVIRTRFILSCAFAACVLMALSASHSSQISSKIAEFATPIDAAAQVVVDSAKSAGTFTSYLPGSYK